MTALDENKIQKTENFISLVDALCSMMQRRVDIAIAIAECERQRMALAAEDDELISKIKKDRGILIDEYRTEVKG